ncbi:MAG: hypothetical protein AAF808_19845, partial [Cyanobacteria bacterium P01_D01_bin.2]
MPSSTISASVRGLPLSAKDLLVNQVPANRSFPFNPSPLYSEDFIFWQIPRGSRVKTDSVGSWVTSFAGTQTSDQSG